MKFDKNLAAIHAYLCSDGYVIKNPRTQKHKYYYIGFRNTNLILLKDFQKKFNDYFSFEKGGVYLIIVMTEKLAHVIILGLQNNKEVKKFIFGNYSFEFAK